VIGTAINALAILVGGAVGLASASQIPLRRQQNIRVVLGAFAVFFGLRALWIGIGMPGSQRLRNFAVVLVALMLGKLTGHLLGIQRGLNRIGRHAKQQYETAPGAASPRFADGFITGTIVYVLAPLATLGAVQDGLLGDFRGLAVKAVMDGLAAMAFARTFGWSVLASALPLVAYQGTLTLVVRAVAPDLEHSLLLGPLYAASGFILFTVALVILQLRKTEVSDYFPALVYAAVLSWLVAR